MIHLLHRDPPYRHARHYLGYAEDDGPEYYQNGDRVGNVEERFQRHVAGRGARLTQVAVQAGCKLILAATFPGDRNEERRLKQTKQVPRICPICNGAKAERLLGSPCKTNSAI